MTESEKRVAKALQMCSFLPGSFDKRFVKQLPNWYDRPMTSKGRETLNHLAYKYRKQIKEHLPPHREVSTTNFTISDNG